METAGWPVDLPRARVDLVVGRRRHRFMTIPSGLLLFVCMFLPAVKACDAPVYPAELPYVWHPYVYGLALAIAAFALTARSVRHAVTMMRVLAWVALAGGAILMALSAALAVVEMGIGGVLLIAIGTSGHSERRIALSGVLMSVLDLLWFGLWSGTPGALVGVYLSLGASICLLAGCLLWLSEI